MSEFSDVEKYLADLPEYQRRAHLQRIADDKAAAARRAVRAQKDAEAEARRHDLDGGKASGEAAAEAFLARSNSSRRSYYLDTYRAPSPVREPPPNETPNERALRLAGY